jgi:hypothetical protein
MIITKSKALSLNYPNPNLQTILINKKVKRLEAIKWLKEHHYHSRIREDVNYFRAMQFHPIKGAEYYSKHINPNIILVWQKY